MLWYAIQWQHVQWQHIWKPEKMDLGGKYIITTNEWNISGNF